MIATWKYQNPCSPGPGTVRLRVLATLGQELAGAGSLVAKAVQLSPHLLCVAVLADLEAVDHELRQVRPSCVAGEGAGRAWELGFFRASPTTTSTTLSWFWAASVASSWNRQHAQQVLQCHVSFSGSWFWRDLRNSSRPWRWSACESQLQCPGILSTTETCPKSPEPRKANCTNVKFQLRVYGVESFLCFLITRVCSHISHHRVCTTLRRPRTQCPVSDCTLFQ